jgi:DNA-binding XRE family transcriptional regulator
MTMFGDRLNVHPDLREIHKEAVCSDVCCEKPCKHDFVCFVFFSCNGYCNNPCKHCFFWEVENMITEKKRGELNKLPLKQILNETGMTQLFFARRLHVSKQAVSQVVNGRDTSARLERAIREYCYRMYL